MNPDEPERPKNRIDELAAEDVRWLFPEPRYPSDEEGEAFEELMSENSDAARQFRRNYYRSREQDI